MASAVPDASQTRVEQFFAQLRAKPTLALGILPATGAIASAMHSAIMGNPLTANIAISLFKMAFMAPSVQGLITEWQKDPTDRSTTELFKGIVANLCLAVAAIAPWGPMAEYIALAIVTTAPVPSLVASSIPGFSGLYQTFIAAVSATTAALGVVSLTQKEIEQELFYANLAGALLSIAFLCLDLPDALRRKFAAGTVLSMLASAGVQLAAVFVDMPVLFPLALLCIAVGSACVNTNLLTFGMEAAPGVKGRSVLRDAEAVAGAVSSPFGTAAGATTGGESGATRLTVDASPVITTVNPTDDGPRI